MTKATQLAQLGRDLTYDSANTNITSPTGTLSASGVSAGSYGSSSQIPIITVNNKGIVTNASYASIDAASAQAAFDKANTATNNAASASQYANTGINNAASASLYANSGITLAQASYNQGNSTATVTNTAINNAASASLYANTGINNAASASLYANSGVTLAQASYNQGNSTAIIANTAVNNAASASLYANSGVTLAQAAYNQGNGTAIIANTKFDTAGGTITGNVTIANNKDLTVTGNLYVQGNTVSINTSSFTVTDSLILLATGNYTTDTKDIGFAGHYNAGSNAHTGIVRDSANKEWYIFDNYTPELDTSDNLNITDPSFRTANVNAQTFKGNVIGTTVVTNGVNLGTHVQSAFNQANTGVNNAASASLYANTGINNAASASLYANTGINNAASASLYANTGINNAASASQYANTAINNAASASAYANSAVRTVTGTTNQITSSGTTAITLSTPQNIHTGANFQVNSLGVGTAASAVAGEIRATNDITAFYSDDRLKTKLGNIENALDKLCTLSGFYYEPNQTAQDLGYEVKRHVGVSAQEVQSVMPEVVKPAPISDQYLTVQYEKLVPLLIQAIKELKAEVDSIKGS